MPKNRVAVCFWCLIILVTILRLVFIATAPPSGDELYMWQCSRHLDWCYSDIPLFLPLQIWITTMLAGPTTLGIRLASTLYALVVPILLFQWGRRVWRDEGTGFLAALLYVVLPAGSIGAVYAASDVPMAFWWFLASYGLWRAVQDSSRGWWILTGLFLLLGCLSKYLMIFWVPGAALFLLWDSRGRAWLKRPQPYLALALGGLSAIPFLVWNLQHDWVAFTFQVSQRHRFEPTLKHVGEMLAGQFALASPILFVCLLWALVWAWRAQRKNPEGSIYRLLLCQTLITPAILMGVGLGTRVSPFWPVVGYPAAMLLLAAWAREKTAAGAFNPARKNSVWAGAILSAILVVALHLFVFRPAVLFRTVGGFLDKLGRPTKISQRQLKDFYGSKEIAARVSSLMREMNARHPTFIIAPSAISASFLAFYTDRQYDTFLYRETLPDGRQVGEKSENVMAYMFWQNLASVTGHHVLFVTNRKDDEAVRRFSGYVDRWDLIEEYPVEHEGVELRRFYIYRGENFKGFPAD